VHVPGQRVRGGVGAVAPQRHLHGRDHEPHHFGAG
jgi:hypothetical protein